MGSSEALIRATVNRISARLGHGFADAAADLAVLAQDAPQRLREEWDLFQEEVKAEADRLDREGSGHGVDAESSPASSVEEESLQTKIDQLRARVAELGMRMEERS